MTQKEVAQRDSGLPRAEGLRLSDAFSLNSISKGSSGFDVPPGAFVPRPKVVSHVFKLMPVRRPCADYELFTHLIRDGLPSPPKNVLE
jgi:16S rRNA A1518/A1519 N6-dimethyltransferase RsmA/KsgA/DIM1 with predicted DNA glycosylase/AP lyase activity